MSSPTAPQFCAYCGSALRPHVKFCASCGRALFGYASLAGTGLLVPNHLLKQRYRIQRRLGQGGMGAVYQAADALFNGAQRAIKEMSQNGLSPQELQEATNSFQQEAMLLAGLMHPQLPRIYDYFEEESRWYLVMDFITGETLEARLEHASGGKLPVEDVLDIGSKLCSVLHYLHTRQPPIIFRDLKPANVMVTPENDLYLIDFGIARLFKPGQTKDTMLLGSPGYAAPEQYGKAQTTASADIYSLGATLHQLLSGHDPAQNPFQFPLLALGPHPAAKAVAELVQNMVEMDREKRPASMHEVKQELQRLIGLQSSGSAPFEPPTSSKPGTPPAEKTKQEFFFGEQVKHPMYGTGRVTKGTKAFPDGKSVEVDFGGKVGKIELHLVWGRLEKIQKERPSTPSASQPPARAVKVSQKTKQQWLREGITHSDAERYTEALTAYEHALDLDPNYADAWNSKGVTLENLSRDIEALAAYERALDLDPNYVDAWANKGTVLTKLGRGEEAKRAYQKAFQLGWKG